MDHGKQYMLHIIRGEHRNKIKKINYGCCVYGDVAALKCGQKALFMCTRFSVFRENSGSDTLITDQDT